MQLVLVSAAFMVAAICAGVMGYAIQRGATCTVAAVGQVVTQRTFGRLLSLLEAVLWWAADFASPLRCTSCHRRPPVMRSVAEPSSAASCSASAPTSTARACLARSRASARVSGPTSSRPVGFYLGCVSVGTVFGLAMPRKLVGHGSPVLDAAPWLVLPFLAFVLWRVARPCFAGRRERARWHDTIAARIWSPHAATTVIGITFVVMLLLAGDWAYSDVLAELARGMSASLGARSLLALALLAGAACGGWTAGRFRSTRISAAQVARCLAGGMLMAWGSLLLPGGNDALILVAMPLAWPYAWLAFATMCATVAAAQLAIRGLGRPADDMIA